MPVKYDQHVKAPLTEHEYSNEEIAELKSCSESIYPFLKYVKIVHLDKGRVFFEPYPFQTKILETIEKNRFLCILAGRQLGKTVIIMVYSLWYAIFHSDKIIGIVSNKETSAISILSRLKVMYEELPPWIKPGVKEYNKKSIVFDNGTKIMVSTTSADAFRGESLNCISGESLVCIVNDNDEIFYTKIEKISSSNINTLRDMNVKKEKKYYTVYETINKINSKVYVGFHSTDDLNDGYLGSGKILKSAVEKYGPENFEKRYIGIFNKRKDAEDLERKIVNKEFINNKNNYNLSVGGNVCILFGENNGFYGKHHTKETIETVKRKKMEYRHSKEVKERISKLSKKRWEDENYRKKCITSRIGRKYSEETRRKMSDSAKGRKNTKEQKRKISESRKKFYRNMTDEEHKEWYLKTFTKERSKKISDSNKGRKLTEEHINKVNRNPEKIRKTAEKHRGMKRTKETRHRISEALKGRISYNKGKVYCYNPETLEKKVCFIDEISDGWIRGFIPKNGNIN